MLNYIWLGLVLAAVVLGGLSDRLKEVTDASFNAAKTAVLEIALPLIGITALWLGVMRLAERAGMVQSLARLLQPVLRWLFPDVPAGHPAMGSMLMNLSANMIGLTNAATPLGLRAMNDLEKLNRHPGTATNAMCTFLALNTGSVQLLPTTAIGIMAAAGSLHPTAIVGTALLATMASSAAGLIAVKSLERLRGYRLPPPPAPLPDARHDEDDVDVVAPPPAIRGAGIVLVALLILFVWLLWRLLSGAPAEGVSGGAFVQFMNAVSLLAIPFFLAFFPLYAALRRVPVYEEFVEGAKEGFQVAVRIIPYLVAMLVAVGMFRAAGGIDLLAKGLRPMLDLVGFPTELLPMTLMRPLSGSATIGLFTELVSVHGPDSLVSRMGGTILGSTETTLYVVAVYFGAVGIQRTRHAVPAGLIADLAGVIASVAVCWAVFGRAG
ncbi:MAG: spore maturation protein [Verrucomicrobiales bacterium]|nr:spore maturation protein [Verrucomicrobiales bacterium]